MSIKNEVLSRVQELSEHQSLEELASDIKSFDKYYNREDQDSVTQFLVYCLDNNIQFKHETTEHDEDGFSIVTKFIHDSEEFYIAVGGYHVSYHGSTFYNESATLVEPKQVMITRYEAISE